MRVKHAGINATNQLDQHLAAFAGVHTVQADITRQQKLMIQNAAFSPEAA